MRDDTQRHCTETCLFFCTLYIYLAITHTLTPPPPPPRHTLTHGHNSPPTSDVKKREKKRDNTHA